MYTAAVCPNGKYLASAGEDKAVKLWDLAEGKLIHTFEGHTDVVWSLSFSREGTVLASGSADHTVRLWDVNCPASKRPEPPPAYENSSGLLKSLLTKSTPVAKVQFSSRNILLAGGAFQLAAL